MARVALSPTSQSARERARAASRKGAYSRLSFMEDKALATERASREANHKRSTGPV